MEMPMETTRCRVNGRVETMTRVESPMKAHGCRCHYSIVMRRGAPPKLVQYLPSDTYCAPHAAIGQAPDLRDALLNRARWSIANAIEGGSSSTRILAHLEAARRLVVAAGPAS
jgi:hypothetical protein